MRPLSSDLRELIRLLNTNSVKYEAFGFGQAGIERKDFLQPDHVVQLGRAPNRIDILTGISGVFFDEAWSSRQEGKLAGTMVFVIGRDLLIRNKRATGREKDLADIKLLEKPKPLRS